MSIPYLQELTVRLALGAAAMDPERRQPHAVWLRSQQQADGGFGGREGESDPYYTAFALRALWVLGQLDAETGAKAASFLRARLTARESIIDLISLIFAAAICEMAVGEVVLRDDDTSWRANVGALMASLRTSDGGFARAPVGRGGACEHGRLCGACGRGGGGAGSGARPGGRGAPCSVRRGRPRLPR